MNAKLLFGLILVAASLIIGKITTVLFMVYFGNKLFRYIDLLIYILTWPMLIFGVYICGIEGTEYIKRIYCYFSYKYYHEHLKRTYRGGKAFYNGTFCSKPAQKTAKKQREDDIDGI